MRSWLSSRFQMLVSFLLRSYGVVLFTVLFVCQRINAGSVFEDCGGVFSEPKGVISTPNFPHAYPTPIYCEWLIKGSPEKKIILYFTQFYMKDSFYVIEYDYYQDTSTYIGRHDLGRIASWQLELSTLAAYKPYVLIQFSVESIGNRHLRVMDSLLDVYGFNITYEMVDKSTDITKHTCSVEECSYLGNCIVSSDFSKYQCECFEGFFGDQCQYGPYCNPLKNINQCSNGGRCKYFFGSLINQCECLPGFYGAHCEIASGSEDELDKECEALKCSQLCKKVNGTVMCLCREGYKMDVDNGTCIPIARYRMDVTLKLASFTHVPTSIYERQIQRAKQNILETLEQNGISTISKFGIKGLRNSSRTTLLEFYFYCKVSEVDRVDQALMAVVNLTKIGIFRLGNSPAIYETSPELHLSDLSNHDPKPALRGQPLNLVCSARGSKNLTFQWFKDGYKIEIKLTVRDAWIIQIPETVQGFKLSVLNIDNVSPFDAGIFTCKAIDFGDSQVKDIAVEVQDYPQVDLGPMSASIRKGQQVSIKCISPDDSWQEFVYEWFKNGVKIDPYSREEYAEDMYPTGVRLVVSAVMSYAEYTCRVTNGAGSANVTAYIYAISENETNSFCPKNYEGHVMWQQTSGGHFDIQNCPTEQGGYARRNCWCDDTGHCSWTKPNFVKCQSIFLINAYDELEALRLGYQKTTLKKVFDKLFLFVLPSRTTNLLYSGDIDMVAGILVELLVHMKNFPQLVQRDEKISASKLIKLMSEIVTRLASATDEEKELMLAGANMIRMTTILFTEASRSLNFSKEQTLTSEAVEMHVDRYLEVKAPEEFKITVPEEKIIQETKIHQKRNADVEAIYNKPIDVLVIKQKKLTDLLYHQNKKGPGGKHSDKKLFHETVSDVQSVAPYNERNTSDDSAFVEVTIKHTLTVKSRGFNSTACLTWSVDPSSQYKGQWVKERCRTILTATTYTTCQCMIPAHIVVALGKTNHSLVGGDYPFSYEEIDSILLVGYSISMVITFVTLFVYLRTCGHLDCKLYSSHLSFMVCLFLSNVLVLLCVLNIKMNNDLAVLAKLSLHFLYTTEFSFLMVEILHIYLMVKEVGKFHLSSTKCLMIGWGGGVLIVAMVIITSSQMGYNHNFHKICWLSSDHWQIYSFLVPVFLLALCYSVLLAITVWNLRKWKEEWRYVEKRAHLKSVAKSTSILLLLLISCLLALNLNSAQQKVQSVAHIFFYIIMVAMVFINRCLLDKQVRFHLKRMCFGLLSKDPALKTVRSSGSFRAFMKPETVSNIIVCQEEYNISKYYDEVNRNKYTEERKRQLSVLLGSSVGTDSTNDTKSTNTSGGSKESAITVVKDSSSNEDAFSDKAAGDSGIFDYPEGDAHAIEKIRDTDIHTSIFTDPLGRKPSKHYSSKFHESEQSDAKSNPDKDHLNGSNVRKGASAVDSLPLSSSSKTAHKPSTSLQNKQNSPRTRLKGRTEQQSAVSSQDKISNGYIRNPESKLVAVFLARDGDLDSMDECSVLIHNSNENKTLAADGSSCNSKLLSSSSESSNDSPVSQD